MKSYNTTYFLAFITFVFAAVGFYLTNVPFDQTILVEPRDNWLEYPETSQIYLDGDKLFYYTDQNNIGDVVVEYNTRITPSHDIAILVLDENRNNLVTFFIENTTIFGESATVETSFNDNELSYKDYQPLFNISFKEGLNKTTIQTHTDEKYTILSTQLEIEPVFMDFSEYYLIPIFLAFLGLSFFAIAHFARQREKEDYGDNYTHQNERPRRQKRERY